METFTTDELNMEENKFRYCIILLIDDDNHCKIFIVEKSKYYIKNDNKSVYIEILNEFKDIRKSHKIIVKDIINKYYNIDYEPNNMKYCKILLIDDDDHSKIFISKKKLYNVGVKHYVYDNCDDYYYKLFYIPLNDFERLVLVKNNIINLIENKPSNYFERLVLAKNNIVNLIKSDNYRHNITLLLDNINIFICENAY